MTYLQGAFRSFDDDADDISFRFSNGSLNQPADLVSHALPSETKTQSVTTTADISLHSGAVPSSETITYAGSGLVFVNTYGSGVNDAYRSAIIQAENAFQSHFTNSVTLRLTFDEQLITP